MAERDLQVDTYHLSDGSQLELPIGTPAPDAMKAVDQAETGLASYYSKQAATQNAPVTAGDKVYSASTTYPNTYMGQGMAWLDHNVPGANWVNQNVVQSAPGNFVSNAVVAPVARADTNVIGAVNDLPAAVYNTIKHQTPANASYPDWPSLSEKLRQETGAPELPANAGILQRGSESALAGVLGGGGFWKSLLGGFGGTVGSDIGGYVAGEPGALVGGFTGATIGDPLLKVGAKWVGPNAASPTAEGTTTAAENIKPTTKGGNFQGLTQPPPPGMPDYSDFQPSFTSLANPAWQRIATALGSLPYVGKPIDNASAYHASFIENARDAAANDLAAPGGGLPRLEPVSASTIAAPLREGSQSALLDIMNQSRARQNAVDDAMRSAGVPLRNTVQTGFDQVANNARSEQATDATLDKVGEIIRNSPGGSRYAGPDVPLPSEPITPWSFTKDWVGELNQGLQSSGKPPIPDDIAAALKAAANQDRENAANAVQPGLGDTFRQNNEAYARLQPTLDKLYRMGGEPLGVSGQFKDVPREQDIARQFTGNIQSPEYLADTLLNPNFPTSQRLNAVGQYVSTLGNQGGADNFRPEKFVTDYRGTTGARPTIEALSVGPNGAPLATTNVLDNAADVARNYSTPTSRFGLSKSLGATLGVAKLMELTGRGLEHIIPWKPGQYAGTLQMGRAYANMLESEAMKRAMANQPQNWGQITGTFPAAVGVTQTNANSRALAHSLFAPRPGQTP